MRFPEFVAFRMSSADVSAPIPTVDKAVAETTPLTPDEQIRLGYGRLKTNLAAELLERVRQVSPKFFEELVVELLVAMGYGGSREDASSVRGGSGDEGIDGIIKEPIGGAHTQPEQMFKIIKAEILKNLSKKRVNFSITFSRFLVRSPVGEKRDTGGRIFVIAVPVVVTLPLRNAFLMKT